MGTMKVRHTTLVDALEIPAAVTNIYQMFMEHNIVLSHISCARHEKDQKEPYEKDQKEP